MAKSISIQEYLRDRLLNEIFDGPLTDYEGSDAGDVDEGVNGGANEDANEDVDDAHAGEGRYAHPLLPAASQSLSRSQKRKERSACRRRQRRALQQELEKVELKRVAKKRRTEATAAALQLDFSAEDLEVTKPGWLGKRVGGLPRKAFTKDELKGLDMSYFPWDGRCEPLTLAGLQLPSLSTGLPTSSLTRRAVSSGLLLANRRTLGPGKAFMTGRTAPFRPRHQGCPSLNERNPTDAGYSLPCLTAYLSVAARR